MGDRAGLTDAYDLVGESGQIVPPRRVVHAGPNAGQLGLVHRCARSGTGGSQLGTQSFNPGRQNLRCQLGFGRPFGGPTDRHPGSCRVAFTGPIHGFPHDLIGHGVHVFAQFGDGLQARKPAGF